MALWYYYERDYHQRTGSKMLKAIIERQHDALVALASKFNINLFLRSNVMALTEKTTDRTTRNIEKKKTSNKKKTSKKKKDVGEFSSRRSGIDDPVGNLLRKAVNMKTLFRIAGKVGIDNDALKNIAQLPNKGLMRMNIGNRLRRIYRDDPKLVNQAVRTVIRK